MKMSAKCTVGTTQPYAGSLEIFEPQLTMRKNCERHSTVHR